MVYDIKKVTVVVDGTFLTGFSEDSVATFEMEEDRMLPHIAVDGEVNFSSNANNSGTLTVTLNSTSPSIAFLNRLAVARQIIPVTVLDQNTNGISVSGTQCIIKNPMFPEKGKEVSEVEFEIFIGDADVN
jgi:hypothetical protein